MDANTSNVRTPYAAHNEPQVNLMSVDQALGQARPILSIIGSIIIAAGLAKFFGAGVPMAGSGIEIAAAGWLIKQI